MAGQISPHSAIKLPKAANPHQADLTGSGETPEALFQEVLGQIEGQDRAVKLSKMSVLRLRFLGFLLRMKRDTIAGWRNNR